MKYIKQYKFVFLVFLIWRISISIALALTNFWLPLQKDFLGGGLKNYLNNPQFWAFVNFDGEHYLALAHEGYKPLTYFFFPLYPLFIKMFSPTNSIFTLTLTGLIISHIFIFLALIGLYKLVVKDFNQKIAKSTILLTLLFPASFYFVSLYTESLFLMLVVWSFFFSRNKNWLTASVLAAFASATRITGVLLLPALFVEWFTQSKKHLTFNFSFFTLFLIPIGLFTYMFFLFKTTGDPLIFSKNLYIYGGQRSSSIILLPQVYYRYLFKILPSINSYWPATFTTILEFSSSTIFLLASILSFFKLRLSYSIYFFGGFIVPTLAGSFSSMPRYIIVLFPGFIYISIYLSKLSKPVQITIFTLLFISLFITSSLFFRGYFVG